MSKKRTEAIPPEAVEQEMAEQNDAHSLVEELPCDEATELEQQCETLTEQVQELKGQLLRQMAEFDNYKKRTQKEKDELFTRATGKTVEPFLAVLDNFERAVETSCSDENFAQGIAMILEQFRASFEKLGVTEIVALEQAFDPDLHNAIHQTENEDLPPNTVCQVLQKGYRLGENVLRHALVSVNS